VQAGQNFGESLAASLRVAGNGFVRLPTNAVTARSHFCFLQLDYLKLDSFVQRYLCARLAGPGAFLLVGGSNIYCRLLTQRIHRHVDLAAALLFIAIVSGARSTIAA
jgi:hypothetical protein